MKSSSKKGTLQLVAVDTRLVQLPREIARRTTVALLAALADPSRCEAHKRSEWMDMDFDPEQFSVGIVDARIAARLKSQPA
jgi:hypothetical protein